MAFTWTSRSSFIFLPLLLLLVPFFPFEENADKTHLKWVPLIFCVWVRPIPHCPCTVNCSFFPQPRGLLARCFSFFFLSSVFFLLIFYRGLLFHWYLQKIFVYVCCGNLTDFCNSYLFVFIMWFRLWKRHPLIMRNIKMKKHYKKYSKMLC